MNIVRTFKQIKLSSLIDQTNGEYFKYEQKHSILRHHSTIVDEKEKRRKKSQTNRKLDDILIKGVLFSF